MADRAACRRTLRDDEVIPVSKRFQARIMSRRTLPPGSWPSPISATLIAEGGLRLAQPQLIGDAIYWLEGRAREQGRTVLVREDPCGNHEDLAAPPFNVRSGAQEYGGGVYCARGQLLYFVDFRDHRIYELAAQQTPRPITEASARRFADLTPDPQRDRLVAISEEHRGNGDVVTTLVAIELHDGTINTLAEGADFYSSPCFDQEGQRLAWLEWNHPDMPWDNTTLCLAENPDTSGLLSHQRIAGGDQESIFQPGFGSDGHLYFMSDQSGWWNLCRWDGERQLAVMSEAADCGFGQWVFGMRSWGFVGPGIALCCGARKGLWGLALIDLQSGSCRWLDLPFNAIEHVATAEGRAAFIGAGPTQGLAVVELNTETGAWRVVQASSAAKFEPEWISSGRPIRFPSSNDSFAHGFYYPPADTIELPASVTPPLLVKCHGGPSAHTDAGLDLRIQFWTSRGFAVFDLNYRGSTGYGRAYREALYGQWGVADVEDAVLGARYLVEQGLANPAQLAISGGSAGGFTVLSALAFHDTFTAGASLYGVSDLESLLADTHKFEARYLDRLIGPWPASRDLYRARSPLRHADQLAAPVIFLQGLKDKVVTPDQSERMATALRDKGVPVLYITFPEEGHGFRQADNIVTALEAELWFYSRVFGFDAPGIEFNQTIENLED